jgi:hypothetical protein
MNWSVIPLVGGADPQRGKRPALPWQPYRSRRPGPAELRRWFSGPDVTAYGVICGQVSQVVVLDLDDPALADRFMRRFPQLLDTLVVASGVRQTPHIYWQVDFPVKTRQFMGADLKAEGGYVVGPGSVIGPHTWRVLADRDPRKLAPAELAEVVAFFQPSPTPAEAAPPVAQSQRDYRVVYTALVDRLGGRNHALFATACMLRDTGHGETRAVRELAEHHALQAPVHGICRESFSRRYAEAQRTIASAYSRPARPRSAPAPHAGYPNAVREALLNQPDGITVARILDGARLQGLDAGAVVTEPLLCRALAGIISRETIRKALAAVYPDGGFIFCPPENPPAQADIPDGIERQKSAFLSGGQKQTKPARQYVLPTAATLCAHLSVTARGSDPITLEDVKSVRRYRQALHLGLLQRRPGVYSQALLARRLGISRRSVRRYNRELAVQVSPTFTETPVLWLNIEELPPAQTVARHNLRLDGQFLLDDTGKRWPLKREIAEQLLRQGRRVSRMRQGCNHYAVVLPPPAAQPAVQPSATAAIAPGSVLPARPASDRPDLTREGPFLGCAALPAVKTRKSAAGASRRRFRRPLLEAADERLAQRAQQQVPDLSLANARRLVQTYDRESVAAALRKLDWLQTHANVNRPSGMLITLARLSWRARHEAPAPRFLAAPRRSSRADRTYVAPPDDPLWQSAAYQDWRAAFFGWDDVYAAQPILEETAF